VTLQVPGQKTTDQNWTYRLGGRVRNRTGAARWRDRICTLNLTELDGRQAARMVAIGAATALFMLTTRAGGMSSRQGRASQAMAHRQDGYEKPGNHEIGQNVQSTSQASG
jgi:hypothetical protein